MTEPVRKMYKEAKANKQFLTELLAADDTARKPKWYWDDMSKIMYTTVYMGWLVAQGLYDKENYM